uniref:Uncharacterized protein n=1 Tax=Rhizophora mucronata TaxID=61149 RepID=A0A2P2QL16_RHIMU
MISQPVDAPLGSANFFLCVNNHHIETSSLNLLKH